MLEKQTCVLGVLAQLSQNEIIQRSHHTKR